MSAITVWVEEADEGESTVWGCNHCATGGWCPNTETATTEAKAHARKHGVNLTTPHKPRGPQPDQERDRQITELRAAGHTLRAIAARVGLSHIGVRNALNRTTRP